LGKTLACGKLFEQSSSSEGYCCSFNYNPINVEADRSNVKAKLRTSGAGRHTGLSVTIDVEPQHYLSPTRSFVGAEILIHDSTDFPETSMTSTTVQPGEDVNVAISPAVVVSTADIGELSMKLRQCWFSHERKLRNTHEYSFASCMTECRVDAIINRCHCIPFFYPELSEFG